MAALESIDLFRNLGRDELQALRFIAQERHFAAGCEIFHEDDPGNGVYFVKDGLVEISSLVSAGARRVFSQLGPGEIFGEMAMIEHRPRSATASAVKDTDVYFLPRGEMLSFIQRSPALAFGLLQHISHRLRPDPRARAKARIRKQVERISDMVGDILIFTEGKPADAEIKPASYHTFVLDLIADLRAEAELKDARIEMQNEPPAILIPFNPRRLSRVFSNLVHNATDMMLNGGTIFLRFHCDEKEIVTEIEDTGPGIAPEIADKLFEVFVTFGKAHGTGLGLSICKKIIEDHKGRIWARNEPGRGAVFAERRRL